MRTRFLCPPATWLVLGFTLLLLTEPRASALPSVRTAFGCLVQVLVYVRQATSQSLAGAPLDWRVNGTGRPIGVKLGGEVGAGFFSRVYDVSAVDDPQLIQNYDGRVVAKIGHIGTNAAEVKQDGFSSRSLREENASYQVLQDNMAAIRADAGYPRDPAWGERGPMVPILNYVETDGGPVLFKPFVRGRSPKNFMSMADLTPEMRQGLEDLLAYGRATDRAVPGGFPSDLRPPNLLWIEDAAVLKAMGYKKPGWILVEQDMAPARSRHYVKADLKGYLDEFKTYTTPVPKVPLPVVVATAVKAGLNPHGILNTIQEGRGPVVEVTNPVTGSPTFVVSDPEIIRLVLKDTDRSDASAYAKDPHENKVLAKVIGDDNLFTAPADVWKPQRKALAPAFTPKEVSGGNYGLQIDAILTAQLERIAQQAKENPAGVDVNYIQAMSDLTLNSVLRLLFNYDASPEEIRLFEADLHTVFDGLKAEIINPLTTPVHKLPSTVPGVAALKAAHARIEVTIGKILKNMNDNPEQTRGFLAMLKASRKDPTAPLTLGELKNQILTFIVAGHETTAYTMRWAFRNILSDPAIKQKLTALVRSGNGAAANEYIDAVWQESLRLNMPTLFISRHVVKGTKITTPNGVIELPKDSTVILNLVKAHKNEAQWGVEKTGYPASEFHPERFLPENMKKHGLTPQDVETFSFGSGPRVCIGLQLARLEARKVMYGWFNKFDMNLVADGPVRATASSNALVYPNTIHVTPRTSP